MNNSRPKTAIMLQYAGIGDMVWHIGYFRAIADQSRDGKVTVIAQPSTLPKAFLSELSFIEEVIEHDHRPRSSEQRRGKHSGLLGMLRMAKEIRERRFDRIILFSGRPSRGLIAALSGISMRVGFGYRRLQRVFLNTPPFIDAYRGKSLAVYPEASELMIKHGFVESALVPSLTIPDRYGTLAHGRVGQLPRPMIALAIGTSEPHKQWGASNYADLAVELLKGVGSILLVGGPSEANISAEIKDRLGSDYFGRIASITDMPIYGSAAILEKCELCIGNDTGVVNIAAAVGVPTIVIIGSRPTLDHDPDKLFNVTAKALTDIKVNDVINTIDFVVKKRQKR